MTKVLVTGSSGYIGTHVVRNLLNKNCKVYAISRKSSLQADNLININQDIFNSEVDFYKLADEPDCCIHLAWKDGFVHNSPYHFLYLSQHFNFLKNLIDNGLKSLSVLGSMHEVGYWEGPIDENTPCRPSTLYGIAKNSLREALLTYCKEKKCSLKWLRAYYIYGDEERANNIFAKILAASQNGAQEFPFTAGKNLYDFIQVDELAEQIVQSTLQNEIKGIIECCSGRPISLRDAAESFIASRGLNIKLKYGAFASRPYDSPGVWGDSSKIFKICSKRIK